MRTTVFRAVKFGSQLKELRIHLCQTDNASKGVREFIESSFVNIKNENPHLPILVRECSGVQPRIWARFELGKEKSATLTNLSSADVLKQIETIAK